MPSHAPFEDVITSAVAAAVRRAVEDVGRAPIPELEAAAASPTPAVQVIAPPRPPVVDAYEVVGVTPGATWDEIVAAHRARARAWHPDAPGSPHADGELLRRLNAAYDELRVRRGRRSPAAVLQPTDMARKRNKDDGSETADLDAPEHAWWTSTPIDPFHRDDVADPPPAPPPPPPPTDPPVTSSEVVPDDPYEVLRLGPSASWEEIVASYRKLARWYHPDGLADPSPVDLASCEAMIRRLNAAYAELRVRRGR